MSVSSVFLSYIQLSILCIQELSLSLSAYLRVLRLWSADDDPGEMQAIMTTFDLFCLLIKESRNIKVSLDALKGTWSALSPIARMHSFSASKLYSLNSTFYLFKHLTFSFDDYCFEYLGPFSYPLNQQGLAFQCPTHFFE